MERTHSRPREPRRLNLSDSERERRAERLRTLNREGKAGWAASEKKLKFLISKFIRLVDVRSDSECWIARKTQRNGYSVTLRDGKRVLTGQRAAIELATGEPVPQGMHVDHVNGCSRACLNPAHLEVVTPSENNKRAWARRKQKEAEGS